MLILHCACVTDALASALALMPHDGRQTRITSASSCSSLSDALQIIETRCMKDRIATSTAPISISRGTSMGRAGCTALLFLIADQDCPQTGLQHLRSQRQCKPACQESAAAAAAGQLPVQPWPAAAHRHCPDCPRPATSSRHCLHTSRKVSASQFVLSRG